LFDHADDGVAGPHITLDPVTIAPRTTGISFCPESNPDNYMAIAQMALSILQPGSASMLRKS
jgi:hypothetical protein